MVNRHKDQDMAAIALRNWRIPPPPGSAVLRPLNQSDRFESCFAVPIITIPDELIKNAVGCWPKGQYKSPCPN